VPSDVTELEVLPRRTPEPWDVDQLVKSLARRNAHAHVVVDLSRLDIVDSCFVARLMSLNKLIHAAGGRLVLRGLCPLIQETFAHLRLSQAFEMDLSDA
jgi:anti-anti-sigma factor